MSKSFAVFTSDKSGGSSGGLTAHIERKKLDQATGQFVPFTPDSVIHPERTKLNREFILKPGDSRTAAIARRIKEANVSGKIRDNAVHSLQFVATSDHEKMAELERTGKLDEWVQDVIDFCKEQFGAENVVSVVLHMDEKTPHLHITVVPIVSGPTKERKTKPKLDEDGKVIPKRRYKRKEGNRLCAKEVNCRANMFKWQDEFAAKMAKYGMVRGIPGSGQKHTDPSVWNAALGILGMDERSKKFRAKVDEIQQEHKDAIARLQDNHSKELNDQENRHAAEVKALTDTIAKQKKHIDGEPNRQAAAVNSVKQDLKEVNDKLANANGTITALKNRIGQQNKQLSQAQTDVRTATKRADDAEKEVKQLQDAVAVGRGYLSALARVLYRLSEVIQEAVSALIARAGNMDKAYRYSFTPGQAMAVNAGLNEIPTDRQTAADLLWELSEPEMKRLKFLDGWKKDARNNLNELAKDESLVNLDAARQLHK